MISNGKDLFALIDSLLKPKGYVKRKDTWYFTTTECICFFCLRKSDFGGYYDDLMGCVLKEIYVEKDEYPKYNKNHLKYSLENFLGRETVKKAFDLESMEFTDDEREQIITGFVNKYVIPFLADVSTKAGIKNSLNKYEGLKYLMKINLKKALSIDIDDQNEVGK